jgi:pilus assembly protein TadC
MVINLIKVIGRAAPKEVVKSTEKALNFAGIDESAEIWLAKRVLACAVISLALALSFTYYLAMLRFEPIKLALAFVLSLLLVAIAIAFVFYMDVYYRIDERRKKCQRILPDFLSLVATNINAGVEPVTALYMSLRPDFSPITEELSKLRSLSISSSSVLEQLAYLEKRIDSRPLKMALRMIEKGTISGGKLSILLENVAADLRESNEIENELKTATRGYVYFILFLVIIGVPLLLAASSTFIKTIFSSGYGGSPSFLLFITIEKEVSIEKLNSDALFAIFLIISSITSSLMLGVIWDGEVRNGVKYIPAIAFASFLSFSFFTSLIQRILTILGI